MGPLSAKQHREYLKFASQEARETAKMEREEARKQSLHEIKLMEAAGKAGQALGQKEEVHKYKMGTLGAPLKLKTPNPLAGTEIFKRGQHMLPYQAEDKAKARKAAKENTDTVPAMLTPGEAVIPQPAAQDPKNKPIIKRMVQEGREANNNPRKNKRKYSDGTMDVDSYRDGSVNIVNSDVIPSRVQQAVGYNEGTIQVPVPSLAYEHSDVPGSSFKHGTENVPEFSRGSSDRQYYEDGTEEVPMLSNMYKNIREIIAPQPYIKQEPYTNSKPLIPTEARGSIPVMAEVVPTPVVQEVTNPKVVEEAVIDNAIPRYTDPTKEINSEIVKTITSTPEAVQPNKTIVEVPKPITTTSDTYFVNNRSPVPQVANEKTSTYYPNSVTEVVNPVPSIPEASDAEMRALANTNDRIVPPLKPEEDDTRPEYWIKQLKGSQKDVDKAMANKDDESAIKSLQDVFTYKGIKSLLGLNDQEVARLAVATVAGRAMGYDTARALSFGGKQAFETSLRRQAQEEANKRQDKQLAAQTEREDMRTAITLAGQAKADKKATAAAALAEKKYDLQSRIADAKEVSEREYRRFQQLKEDNKWNFEKSNAARKDQENLNDNLQKYLAMDVNPAVRAKALGMVSSSKTPEEWLTNMRNATTFLAANVEHYRAPVRDPVDRQPKEMMVNGVPMMIQFKGNNYQTPDGRLIPPNAVRSIEGYKYEEQKVADKVEALIPEGSKDKFGKPYNAKAIGNNANRILNSVSGGLSIDSKADVINSSIPQLLESGVQDPATISQVIRGNITKNLSPSDKNLWREIKGKTLSANSMAEFTNTLDIIKNNAASQGQVIDDQTAFEALKRKFNDIPADVRTKMEKANLTQDGYSVFQDWAIATTKGSPKWKSYIEPTTKK